MHTVSSVTIVGGGIVGSCIAYALSQKGIKNITVVERNDSIIGVNQSLRNGGVIHSGLYYPKDIEPLKASLCVEGSMLLYEFCRKYKIPHKKTGKLILAKNEKEAEYLEFFKEVGTENGVLEMKMLTFLEAKAREPNIGDIKVALYVPSTGSVALVPLIKKIKELAEENGVTFRLDSQVVLIDAKRDVIEIVIEKDGQRYIHTTEILINAAGLYADDIAKMINPESDFVIDPARGELFEYHMNRSNIETNGMHIYAAPFCYYNDTKEIANVPIQTIKTLLKSGKVTKTLGVHVSPAYDLVDGQYLLNSTNTVGPLKTLNTGKEDYTQNTKTPKECIDKIHDLFPGLLEEDIKMRYTGIMAVQRGFTDFTIEKDKKYPHCLNLIGMDSPALTASLAIGKYVTNLLK